MFRLIGIFFVSTLLASLLVVADFYLPGNFLNNFIGSEFVQMFAAILGFNFAAIIFLLGQIFMIENSEKELFKNTKKEIKQNGVFLLSAFALTLLLLIFRPDLNQQFAQSFFSNLTYYLINIAILSIFIVSIFAVYEILNGAFLLAKKTKQ